MLGGATVQTRSTGPTLASAPDTQVSAMPGFQNATRIHGSFLAAAEKRALIWMAERMPGWMNSDHLTAIGFAAQLATGACYALAGRDRRMLLVVIVCLSLNWFGDSLDGTLARVRQQQRPRYGFYVDHMIDSIGATAMMGGLALSGYMHPVIAIGLLIAFLLLSIQSYLATYTIGEFHLSFWRFGPTELRILLAIGNLHVPAKEVELAHETGTDLRPVFLQVVGQIESMIAHVVGNLMIDLAGQLVP